jgi:hypothetical protein
VAVPFGDGQPLMTSGTRHAKPKTAKTERRAFTRETRYKPRHRVAAGFQLLRSGRAGSNGLPV